MVFIVDLVVVGNTVGLTVVSFVVTSSLSSFSHPPHVRKHFLTTSSQLTSLSSSRHSIEIKYRSVVNRITFKLISIFV